MLLQDDGKLYAAVRFNHLTSADAEQSMMVWAVDTLSQSLIFKYKSQGWLGRSASLARGPGDNVYLGGSYDATGTKSWDLAFVRIPDSLASSSKVSRLIYKITDCAGFTGIGY